MGLGSFPLYVIKDVLFFFVVNKFFFGKDKSNKLRSIDLENMEGSISFDGLDSYSEKELDISGDRGKNSKGLRG
jgi:hypothetical protein